MIKKPPSSLFHFSLVRSFWKLPTVHSKMNVQHSKMNMQQCPLKYRLSHRPAVATALMELTLLFNNLIPWNLCPHHIHACALGLLQDKHMGRAEPAPAEVLYRRGRTSTMCTLILTGKVVVLAGRDGQYNSLWKPLRS